MGDRRDVYGILVGKFEEKRPLESPWHRWEDNIKIDLQTVGRGVNWIELARDRDRLRPLVNAVMNLFGSVKCWEFLD
jgi:hypothetical protein